MIRNCTTEAPPYRYRYDYMPLYILYAGGVLLNAPGFGSTVLHCNVAQHHLVDRVVMHIDKQIAFGMVTTR
jgi:hypothetical protein